MKVIIKSAIFNEREFNEKVQGIVHELGDGLDLGGLDNIYFTDDFYNDVLYAQEKYGLRKGVTNDDQNKAFGKVIVKLTDPSRYDIYIRHEALGRFKNIGKIDRSLESYLIRHEMCHIHDHNNIGHITKYIKPGVLENDLYTASILWEEYFVNYLSANTYALSEDYNMAALKKSYDNAKIKAVESLVRFKSKSRAITLYNDLHLCISNTAELLCYSFGLMDGNNQMYINELLYKYFGKEFDLRIFKLIYKELIRLRSIYPKWKDEKELSGLFKLYAEMWEYFGVAYVIEGENAYIGPCTKFL